MWDESTYPFSNFNSAAIQVWKWISDFIPHFTEHMMLRLNLSWSMFVKDVPGFIFGPHNHANPEHYNIMDIDIRDNIKSEYS